VGESPEPLDGGRGGVRFSDLRVDVALSLQRILLLLPDQLPGPKRGDGPHASHGGKTTTASVLAVAALLPATKISISAAPSWPDLSRARTTRGSLARVSDQRSRSLPAA
jgi:hypothetical protein